MEKNNVAKIRNRRNNFIFPQTMGERGWNFSLYYDNYLPDQEDLIKDFKKELSDKIKEMDGDVSGFVDEAILKEIKKVLRIWKRL